MSKQPPAAKQPPAKQPAASKQPPAAAPAPAAPAEPVLPVEEKKPEKKEKPKAPKRRIQVYKLYKVDGESLTRLRRDCPRCGKGYFMAQHGNRFTCGHCGYTTYAQKAQA